MSSITLERLSKTFAGGGVALHNVSLAIDAGELMVLVGPSGSGKSTVLRLIAGLDSPSSGRVLLDGQDVSHLPPQDRDLAMVFQSYALYPHLTVRQNLSFGLRMRRVAAEEVAERVARTSATLGIDQLLDRKPSQLSGGQRQRVALGRAIVREPRAFLFDEPLSNLDPALRGDTRAELALLHRRLGTTIVYVTHDQEEAMTLGTRIAVMRDGRIEQVGAPLEVFREPANTFVAGFVGSPAMNFLPADMLPNPSTDKGVVLGLRPHDVAVVPRDQGMIAGRVRVVEPLGSTTLLHVQLDDPRETVLRVIAPGDPGVTLEGEVGLTVDPTRVHLFDKATGRRVSTHARLP